jgi:formiminotetrahydrofolate cyclodeaminase
MNEPFLLALSCPEPSPGGGAAAAYSACLGIALIKKVINLEMLRPDLSSGMKDFWEDLMEQAEVAEEILEKLLHDDGRSYVAFARARTSGTDETMAAALGNVIACPIDIMEQSCQGQGLISEAGKYCKRHLLSDLLVAGEFFLAAVQGAHHIAQANLSLVPGRSLGGFRGRSRAKIGRLQNCCQDAYDTVQEQLRFRMKQGAKEEPAAPPW